jgi:hypothetical protein
MDMAFERSDWVPTAAAQALIRNNRPLLAYIGGQPERFTSKDHNYRAGESVEKQVIVINNSRETVTGDCEWSLELPQPVSGRRSLRIQTGEQERIPIRLELPGRLAPGAYRLSLRASFSSGDIQEDGFLVHVLPAAPSTGSNARIALFDPQGETGRLLDGIGVRWQPVTPTADLSAFDLLIIGKGALTVTGPGPDIRRVREGLKVVVFEQTAEALEKRLGFRATEYGLRQVFPRLADHPLLEGLEADHLRDWRGEATICPPRLTYTPSRRYAGAPSVRWCDLDVTRVWRCGNRGNVASVLIEKPPAGDFLPIADGGFSLQYSPLLEYREGQGMVLLCQLDVTGRTESDPAAERLARNLIGYVSGWTPRPARKAVYAGHPAGRSHLAALGIRSADGESAPPTPQDVLILGPGGARRAAAPAGGIGAWLNSGGRLVGIGLDAGEAGEWLPAAVRMQRTEHISSGFGPSRVGSPFAGIGPADMHLREPRLLDAIDAAGNGAVLGNGVVAEIDDAKMVFCQLAPWQFDPQQPNTKRTHRRVSFLVSRLLSNMGVSGTTPLLGRFGQPPASPGEKRWLDGLYPDAPQEWDDPYRFFRW